MSPLLALLAAASPEVIATAAPAPLVIAQEAAPVAAQSAAAETQGTTPYPASFFAEAQPNSAMDMIMRIPGFAFDGGDSVRGYGGAAGNVLIDGQRPATKSESLEDALRRIQAKQVERIDIIRGGAPGIDMQGKTVIANVILKKDAGSQWLFAVASAIHQDGRTTPAMRFEGSAPVGPGTFEWSNLFYRFLDDGAGEGVQRAETGGVATRTAWDETAGGHGYDLKAGWKSPLLGGRLSVNSRYHPEIYEWSVNAFDSPRTGRLFVVRDRNDQVDGEFGGGWERAFGKARVELTALQTLREVDFTSQFDDGTDDALFSEHAESGETIGRASLRYTFGPNLIVEGGGELAFNYLETSIDYAENGVPVVLPSSDVRVEEERGEIFTTANWRLNPKFALEAGLKVEFSTISQSGDTNLSKSFTYPKPRLIATWDITSSDQLRVRVEREVGQLNFRDFASSIALSTGGTVTAGGADLEPSKATVYEATYERKFWKDGALVLSLTHEDITDATDRIRVTDVASCPLVGGIPDTTDLSCNFDAPGNIGEGKNTEFEIRLTLPLAKLGVQGGLLRVNTEWSQSEVTDPTTGEQRRISGQAPFEWEVRFSQDLPKHRTQWGVDVFGAFQERYYRFDRIDQIELETWVTFYAEWKPRPDFAIRIEAHNLLGRDVTRSRQLYDAPRDTGSVYFVENRPLDFPSFFYMRLRKTF
ncbi:TonB-dependent receptor [Caulobacter sp. SLTY]|uniref:TonB-dependent receptor plug domain-containing protein n=1 Tax=Caulobacter sp. SLTY TaxID=2683262 RepID=UPI0014129E82|nr:TonB-dependent receptor [Caulobacter sp. SLTY]NBB15972.1 TonB-dependent receptor [Caulobacter sp. SLTY]